MSRNEPTLTLISPAPRTALFDRFVSDQRASLLGFLRRMTHCDEDAEDIAQESFLGLVRYRESEPVEAWRPLLFRIAVNAFNDRLRRNAKRADVIHLSLDEVIVDVPSQDAPHDKQIADQQELMRVRATILELPERCRQIYLLNRIEGMSYTEIARHCDISVKAVEKQITKALATLRERLDEAVAQEAGETT